MEIKKRGKEETEENSNVGRKQEKGNDITLSFISVLVADHNALAYER